MGKPGQAAAAGGPPAACTPKMMSVAAATMRRGDIRPKERTWMALKPRSARGRLATGRPAIREVYADLLASRPRLTGEIRPAIRSGDIAITSTVRAGNATVEVARRQPNGTWLWLIDQPSVLD